MANTNNHGFFKNWQETGRVMTSTKNRKVVINDHQSILKINLNLKLFLKVCMNAS